MALGWRNQYSRYRGFFLNIQTLYKKRADLRAFIELMLSISTVIIFINFALKPTALTIISLYREIQNKKDTIAALDQKLTSLDTAANLLNDNSNAIPDIEISVGEAPRPSIITEQIQALATKNSVNILGVSVGQMVLSGPEQTQKNITGLSPLPNNAKPMDISVSVKADYPALISFIKDFENLRTIIKVDTNTISASTSDQTLSIVAVLTGRVPYIGKK